MFIGSDVVLLAIICSHQLYSVFAGDLLFSEIDAIPHVKLSELDP